MLHCFSDAEVAFILQQVNFYRFITTANSLRITFFLALSTMQLKFKYNAVTLLSNANCDLVCKQRQANKRKKRVLFLGRLRCH